MGNRHSKKKKSKKEVKKVVKPEIRIEEEIPKLSTPKLILEIVLLIILFTIPLSLISLNAELFVGDELWNFQNISKLINGGTMYVNCNIIITPIFYLIGYCFVKLITGTILGFRIYNIFIFLGLLLSSFGLFRSLKINRIKSFIYSLLVLIRSSILL